MIFLMVRGCLCAPFCLEICLFCLMISYETTSSFSRKKLFFSLLVKGNGSLVTYPFCVQERDFFVYEVTCFLITFSFLMMANPFWMMWF